jgi:hypothetical protein
MRAELNLRIVDGEMHNAASELEQLLARIAVALVLLDRIVDILLGQAVLQLEGCNRQAIDEQREVKRVGGIVAAVAKLARYREAVERKALHCLRIAGRG